MRVTSAEIYQIQSLAKSFKTVPVLARSALDIS